MIRLLSASYLAQHRTAPVGEDLDMLIDAFEMSLAQVPTEHLPMCFQMAMACKVDTFPLSAPEVNAQWQVWKDEEQWAAPERVDAPADIPRLPEPRSYLLSLDEFRVKHNLPATWKLGDPYPEGSDLHNKPVPGSLERDQERYYCFLCLDAGWVRIPYDVRARTSPKLVRCVCKR